MPEISQVILWNYNFSLKLNSISNKSVMLFMEYLLKNQNRIYKEKYVDFTEFTT